MFDDFYSGKRVLITGADGFLGSHLTEKLLELRAKVTVLLKSSSVNGTSQYSFKKLPKTAAEALDGVICCDIASVNVMDRIYSAKPEIIFHLAASAYVPYSFDYPIEVTEANLIGTMHVLEVCKKLPKLSRVVVTSSSEIYGTAQAHKINESHALNPSSPYAASKVAVDRYCYSYITTYDLPIAVIRPFNFYGPRHTYDVIPKFIRLALEEKPITVYGNGEQSRDLTYIDDMVGAFLTMGSHDNAIHQFVNFGTGVDVQIKTIARLIKEISGTSSEIVHIEKRLAEVDRLTCDFSLAEKLFNWKPTIFIEEGLEKNIAWAKKCFKTGRIL